MIIHNAWRLDFNLTLASFESNVRGTRNLIDLARSGANNLILKFLFTSSIASAQSWDQSRGPYPEQLVSDAKYAVGGGYGEGKYVAERVRNNVYGILLLSHDSAASSCKRSSSLLFKAWTN